MQGALTIRRLRTDCRVAAESAHLASAVGDRITRAVRDHLPQALRGALASWLDGSDESIWIVRRVDLDILTAPDTHPGDLASAMTRAMGRALAATIAGDGDGANAIRFAHRAAYLAQFVADAAAAEAWGRWYYEPFGGLRLLAPSAVVRTALTQDPEQGWAALQSLDERRLARVVGCLTRSDEDLIVDAFTRCAADATDHDAVLTGAKNGCARALNARVAAGRRLFAMTRAETAPSPQLAAAIAAMLAAVAAAATTTVPGEDRANPGRDSRDTTAPAVLVRELLAGEAAASGAARSSRSDGLEFTRFGGLALLLRDLDALPWAEWTRSWPESADGQPADLLKWLTLAVCSGPANAGEFAGEGVWKWLFGLSNDTSLERASAWLEQAGAARRAELMGPAGAAAITAADRRWLTFPRRSRISAGWTAALAGAAGSVLRRFANRLPGFADSTSEHLWRNFLDMDATVEVEPDRVVVECGRPPLHLLLTITGMTRGLVTGRTAGGLPIVVFGRG
jgi:hypothetical protein